MSSSSDVSVGNFPESCPRNVGPDNMQVNLKLWKEDLTGFTALNLRSRVLSCLEPENSCLYLQTYLGWITLSMPDVTTGVVCGKILLARL